MLCLEVWVLLSFLFSLCMLLNPPLKKNETR
uniref:Uncharacterized protein n=1 Tax=Rhizophora mucronata TaxID=61149 RepID=A0A2P2QVM8_RHIMU